MDQIPATRRDCSCTYADDFLLTCNFVVPTLAWVNTAPDLACVGIFCTPIEGRLGRGKICVFDLVEQNISELGTRRQTGRIEKYPGD